MRQTGGVNSASWATAAGMGSSPPAALSSQKMCLIAAGPFGKSFPSTIFCNNILYTLHQYIIIITHINRASVFCTLPLCQVVRAFTKTHSNLSEWH